ncbi:hypothetical protein ACFLRC_00120 [Candidatus Altiarchaeota archaeon]
MKKLYYYMAFVVKSTDAETLVKLGNEISELANEREIEVCYIKRSPNYLRIVDDWEEAIKGGLKKMADLDEEATENDLL